jgi:hypothetical protein
MEDKKEVIEMMKHSLLNMAFNDILRASEVLYKASDHQANTIKKATTYDISDSGICFYTDTLSIKKRIFRLLS